MDKKIVFVTHRLNRGGAQKMLTFVANSCAKVFNEVVIISFYTADIEFEINSRIKTVFLPGQLKYSNDKKSFLAKVKEILMLIKLLRNELKIIRPDLICTFGVNYIFISLLSSLGLGIKIVGSERRSPKNLPFLWKKISDLIYPKCDGMVYQLKEVENMYKCKGANKSIVIPNPYLCNKEYIPCPVNEREKTITAAAARLEHIKGFDTLIRAFKLVKERHKGFRLIIYGDGDPKLNYGELIKKMNLEKDIDFPGLVDDVASTVYKSSAFVLPSRFEGIPNTLLEVMGAGVPTVSCDCSPGGPRFLTDDGRRGLLVPVDDYQLLAKAICKIIEDVNLCEQLSHSSLEIRTALKPDIIGKKWTDFFSKILSEE